MGAMAEFMVHKQAQQIADLELQLTQAQEREASQSSRVGELIVQLAEAKEEYRLNDVRWLESTGRMVEELASTKAELSEARRLAQWTRMTPEDFPPKGYVVFVRTKRGKVYLPYIVSDHLTPEFVDFGLEHYFIAPPAQAKEGM